MLTEKYLEKVSFLGFFILFVFFYIYHYSVASFGFPPIFGGVFGIGVVILYILHLPFTFKNIRESLKQSRLTTILFLLLIIYTSLWMIAHITFGNQIQKSYASTEQIATTIIGWIVMYEISSNLNFRSKNLKLLLQFFLLTSAIILAINFQENGFLLDARSINENDDIKSASYQSLARSIFVTSIVLFSIERKKKISIFYFIVSAILLFSQGARAEFFGFFVAIILYIALKISLQKYGIIKFLILTFILSSSLYLLYDLVIQLGGSRQLEVFDLSKSTSWSSRIEYQKNAILLLNESPILGGYATNVSIDGQTGAYVHNILSAWISFGFFGFLLYLTLIISCLTISFYKSIILHSSNPMWTTSFLFNLSSIFMLSISQAVYWIVPALGWGFIINAFRTDRTTPVLIFPKVKSLS